MPLRVSQKGGGGGGDGDGGGEGEGGGGGGGGGIDGENGGEAHVALLSCPHGLSCLS